MKEILAHIARRERENPRFPRFGYLRTRKLLKVLSEHTGLPPGQIARLLAGDEAAMPQTPLDRETRLRTLSAVDEVFAGFSSWADVLLAIEAPA